MTITVGTDTYITVAEADSYIENNRVSTDTQRVAWEALADADKEIYLRRATASIEKIRFPGRKNDSDQTLSFPRDVAGVWPLRRNLNATCTFYDEDVLYSIVPALPYDPSSPNVWIFEDDVPDDIKSAEAEEALELASPGDDTAIWKAARGAVKSYEIGHFSETFRDAPSRTANSPVTILRSVAAQELVSKYFGGGYRVF